MAKRGDGEGSIRRRKDGMWRGRLMVGTRPDGKPDVRDVYAKTRGAVQSKLDVLKAKVGNGTLGNAKQERETVAGYLARCVEAVQTSVRPVTHQRYEELVRLHILPALGRHKLSELKPDHVAQFYAEKLSSDPSARTVHHLHAVLHRALEMAMKWGYVPRNVADAVDPHKVPRREMKPPTPDQINTLMVTAEEAADPQRALYTLAVHSGCRIGELLALQWDDVDWSARTISIRRTLLGALHGVPMYGEPKTSRSARTVALPTVALDSLRAHRDRQQFDRQALGDSYAAYGHVFATSLGTAYLHGNATRGFKRALDRAGLPRTTRFHDLRHASATAMLRAGVHPKAASERLGHSTIGITMDLYSHAVREMDQEAAEKLGAVFWSRTSLASGGVMHADRT